MTVYIALWVAIICMVVLETTYRRVSLGKYYISTRKISYHLLMGMTLLVGCFRAELLGVDCGNYQRIYLHYGKMTFSQFFSSCDSDVGYYLFGKIVYLFTDSFWHFEVILFLITYFLIGSAIYRYSEYPAISFMGGIFGFGFFSASFGLLRQVLAAAIVIYTVRYIHERRWLAFTLATLLAASIHSTAIICLLTYPLVNGSLLRILRQFKWLWIALAVLFGVFGVPIVLRWFHNDYSNQVVSGEGAWQLMVYMVVILGIGYLLQIDHGQLPKRIREEYMVLFLALPVQIVSLFFALFTRMNLYYMTMLILVVPGLMKSKKMSKAFKGLILFCYALGCSILYFYRLSQDHINVPYYSIFDHVLLVR